MLRATMLRSKMAEAMMAESVSESKDFIKVVSSSTDFIFKVVSSSVINEENFICELRANIDDEESFMVWLNNFSDCTKTNWILRTSVSKENSSYDFSRDYVCHHSSYQKNSKVRNYMYQLFLTCLFISVLYLIKIYTISTTVI